MKFTSESLAGWYLQNKRNLPWRNAISPYFIWLSEIILQQTRVIQGTNYYLRFVERFPNVEALALASTDEVLKMWQGLGYYARARNLHETAKTIVKDYNGQFPGTYAQLLKLKGIGQYTAAAIASIAFNEPVALVDGNVARVLSRLFAIKAAVDTSEGKEKIKKLADEILNREQPGLHNQAFMELGALICLPKNPQCDKCPLKAICIAYAKNLTAKLPLKSGKTKTRERYFHYFFIQSDNNIYLHRRSKKDIWQSLYDFPVIESSRHLTEKELRKTIQWKEIFNNERVVIIDFSDIFKHILSHQTIYAKFYKVEIKSDYELLNPDFILISKDEIHKYPVPRLIERYLSRI